MAMSPDTVPDILVMLLMLCSVITVSSAGVVSPAPLKLPCETSSTSTVSCGQPIVQPASTRIIGGEAAVTGSWPWMVALLEEGFLSCGGAIIAPDLVLTATHCFLLKSMDPTKWTVQAGSYRLDRVEQGQVSVKVKQIILHEDYNSSTVANDIALVVLEQPLTYSTLIRPICLPPLGYSVKEGDLTMLAGWGTTRGTADAKALNQVVLPVVSDSTCGQTDWYGEWFAHPDTTFCAGYEEGIQDGCTGDSGGPLILWRSGAWYVQGISSWAFGCAERKWPGVYTEVDKYATWITEQVRQLISNCLVSGSGDIVGRR